MTWPVTELAEKATVRLISDAYFKPPVLRALVDTDEELEILAELEGRTSRRIKAEQEGLEDLDPRELAFRARAAQLRTWGHTYVIPPYSLQLGLGLGDASVGGLGWCDARDASPGPWSGAGSWAEAGTWTP